MESVEVPQPCGCQQDSRFHEVNTAEVLQGVVVWTLLEGTQFAEDPESQQEEVRGDGGARGEGLGFFTFERN